MPKRIFDELIQRLISDIKKSYTPGDRFYSIKEAADCYGVSLQTMQRAYKSLEAEGFLSVGKKVGSFVASLVPEGTPRGKTILVISNQHDRHFNEGFLGGIRSEAEGHGVPVDFIAVDSTRVHTASLAFGEWIAAQGAEGVIALAFRDAALPFYHALREGIDLVADIELDELPVLPSVQTDNFRHSFEAGLLARKKGYTRFLVAGYYPRARNRRYEGFYEAIADSCKAIHYVCLSEIGAFGELDRFFTEFDSDCAVFSVDFSASYTLAAKSTQYGIAVANDNFTVYDTEEDCFSYAGLPPVRGMGPSFNRLGRELCALIIRKWQTGSYPENLRTRI